MKKLIAIVLTLMMCAALAACGGKKPETPEEPQTKATEQAAQNETTPEQTTPEQTTPEQTTEAATPAPSADKTYVILHSDDTHFVIKQGTYYIVAEHEGDKLTDYYAFVDAGDEDLAKTTVEEYLKSDIDESILDVFTEGTYMVITYKESLWGEISYTIMEELYGDQKE